VSVFAFVVFGAATIWVSNQQANADTIVTTDTMEAEANGTDSTSLSTSAPKIALTPDDTTLAASLTEVEPSASPLSNESIGQDTSYTAATAELTSPLSTTVTSNSRTTLHWGILIADALVVLGLLIALTIRILGKVLNPAGPALPAEIAAAASPTGKPRTIDDLNLDI
jgi:hypothetical protein